MVCCYLLYSGQKATADEALNYYGTKRTHDEKGKKTPLCYWPVTIAFLTIGVCSNESVIKLIVVSHVWML